MADKFRVALAGSTGRGDYGHDLDRLWERVAGAEVVAVSDDQPEGLAKAVERTKAGRGYADYREMLDKEKPDILCVCTRWLDQHHAMIMAALDRGIHVLTEKPLCRTLAEADEIVQKSQMTHAQVAVAHTTHYSPASSRKDGSPTLVVPPPINTTGRLPVRCIKRSSMICTKDPTCRLSAVASKPI